MSESTRDRLTEHVESVAEMVREYARQIDSGRYGDQWIVFYGNGDVASVDGTVSAGDEDSAIAAFADEHGDGDYYAELEEADEPTVEETPISEWPLEVVVKVGRPLTVLITAGGPHIEIVHDLSDGSAKLAGYWGGEKVYRHGPEFQTVLDYLTDSLYDEVPEEYR